MKRVPSSASVSTVFFDMGGTVLRVRGSVAETYARVARARGHEVDEQDIDLRFRRAWSDSLARSRKRGHRTSDAILFDEWRHIVRDAFGDSVPEEAIDGLFDELWEIFRGPQAWTLAPGFEATCGVLEGLGVSMGVLSNWDRRLRETLAGLGLLERFEHVVISGEIGHEKPAAQIFQRAIDCAGGAPGEVLHIGDSWQADIEPAIRAGLQVLWMVDSSTRGAPAPGASPVRKLAHFKGLGHDGWQALLRGEPPP